MAPRTLLVGALAVLGACSDSSGVPDGAERPRSPALVSSSIVQPAAASSAAVVVGGHAHVSMVPGTDHDGRRADIRNLRDGASASAPMRNGGFDPVAIPAEAGDTLAIKIFHHGGGDTTSYGVVPLFAKPTIVRTSPAMSKTDVPLNSLILVVFSQPMDGTSLTEAVRLRHEGADVPGEVSWVTTEGVILNVQFVPDGPLAPLSTYELSVSTEARSLAGGALDAPLNAEFTTTASTGGARLRVVHAEPQVGPMDVIVDGIERFRGLPYLAATGYLDLASGNHEVWYQVDIGTMDASNANFTAGAEYTVLPCCIRFPLGGFLFRDDNSAPAAGLARLRILDWATVSSAVKVYLTAPGANLAGVTPTATIDILDTTEYIEVPAGDYQVRITASDNDVVALDSGTLTFGAGQVRTLVATDGRGGGAPREFLVLEDRN